MAASLAPKSPAILARQVIELGMTKREKPTLSGLPATMIEAEARTFARIFITIVGESAFLDGPHATLDPEAARWFVRRLMRLLAELHPLNAAQIVEYAVLGLPEADAVLRELIAEKLDRNEPLGAVLGSYAIRMAHPTISRRGKSKVTNLVQDVLIATLVLCLVERFPPLKPTRFKTTHASACSIVAEILQEAGLNRGDEKAIQAIWGRYAPSILPGYQLVDWGKRLQGFEAASG